MKQSSVKSLSKRNQQRLAKLIKNVHLKSMIIKIIKFLLLLSITWFCSSSTTTSPDTNFPHVCNCTRNSTFELNSTYHTNLKTLFSWLSSNATNSAGSHITKVSSGNSSVYGLFQCNADITSEKCQKCIDQAVYNVTSECETSKEAVVFVRFCFLRYSYRDFLTIAEESPKIFLLNLKDYVGQLATFNNEVSEMMYTLRHKVADIPMGSRRFAYGELNITAKQSLYGMAKCTPDLPPEECSSCLVNAAADIPTGCCKGKIGGRVLFPSCGVRFELYRFYEPSSHLNILRLGGNRKNRSHQRQIIISIISTVVSVLLLCFGCSLCFLSRRRQRKLLRGILLRESFGDESLASFESLQFQLSEIQAATNNFSQGNKIGRGGFGEVYKGVLENGQEVAAKRLLGNSWQGAEEFKNEVLVMAKLQHKNLVRLLGFCLEGQERILVYEYVPNKSLDYILFDPQRSRPLTWSERYNIIRGIARGILYLHEDSRLTIIHRDLKPSNILLDDSMNPKISDFGMARIVITDQIQVNTHRVVGTYGYMSPEYAMEGMFSIRSDVYSFGIIVLEIISGKSKSSFCESHFSDDIRLSAWAKWKEEKPLELLDTTLKGNYSENEVMRSIQIALLCVQDDPNERPTMTEIVSYLNSSSGEVPLPQEPILSKSKKMDYMSYYHKTHSINDSINDLSVSTFLPR
ncbi:cysteine-rich receptor-like protein kinase 25 [Arachis hypogaea]